MGIYVNGKNCSEANKYIAKQEIFSTVPQYVKETQSAGYEEYRKRIRVIPGSTNENIRKVTYTIYTSNFNYYKTFEDYDVVNKTITNANLFELEDLVIVFAIGSGAGIKYYEQSFSQVSSWLQYTKTLDENNNLVLVFDFIANPPEEIGAAQNLFFLGFLTKLKYDGAYCILNAESTTQSPISSKIAKCQFGGTSNGDWSNSKEKLLADAQVSDCSAISKNTILENRFSSGDIVNSYSSASETSKGYFVWFYSIPTPPSSYVNNPTGSSEGINNYIQLHKSKNTGELYEN